MALLAADATGELFVVTIMCTYSPIMERHGKNVFMIILSTVWDVQRIEPEKMNLTVHMSWEDEFGS